MEINTSKKPKNLDEMYSMIVELNNNYKIIREKNEINKKNILSLNIQFKVLLANFTETKEDLKKNIEELKEKVEKVIKANKKDNSINSISNLNSGYKYNIGNLEEKVNTLMKNKFDDLENEIKALKLKLAEKEELKIEDKNGKNIFLNLENKLSMIMAKGEADKNDIEEIKKISKQIIEGTDKSPYEIIMNFFQDNMNNVSTYSIDKIALKKLVDLKVKISESILTYENELINIKNKKNKEKYSKGKEKEKKDEKKNINIDDIHILDEFRKEYNLDKDTYDDITLMPYLKTYKIDKIVAFNNLMNNKFGKN